MAEYFSSSQTDGVIIVRQEGQTIALRVQVNSLTLEQGLFGPAFVQLDGYIAAQAIYDGTPTDYFMPEEQPSIEQGKALES